MDENVQTMVHYLKQTLEPDAAVRKEAEQYLESVEHSPGYLMILINTMMAEQVEPAVRQAAAIFFKNAIKRKWEQEEGGLSNEDKTQIKEQIIAVMLHTPQFIQKQICEAISRIAKVDFPHNWPQLLPSLVEHLSGTDFHAITGVLRAADPIFWRYVFPHAVEGTTPTKLPFLPNKSCTSQHNTHLEFAEGLWQSILQL